MTSFADQRNRYVELASSDTELLRPLRRQHGRLGLPAPRSAFETAERATLTIGAIAAAIKHYGPRVIMREMLLTVPAFASWPVVFEGTVVVVGIGSVFYLGACIGSLAVAAGQTPSVRNFLVTASQLRVQPAPWLMPALAAVAAQVHARHVGRGSR